MLFSSFVFIFAFLPFVWVVFHTLKSAKFATFCAEFSVKINSYTIAKIFLIISSLFFYAFWKVAYLPILLCSIIVNYTLAKTILNANKGGGGQCIDSKFTLKSYLAPKFYFISGIIFNLSLLCFFKYTDFLLENFNAFSQIAHLDFEIPLPHILLPLALSFVTFQQIAFLYDCYKHATGQTNENLNTDFIDYALFISFFPQLIAGPIVHHREMMPQFAKMSANSPCGDFLGSASSHSTSYAPASASHSLASHNPKNSSTMLEFADSNESSLQGEAEISFTPPQTPRLRGGVYIDSPSLAEETLKISPSLAEGARGWVKSTQKSIDCHDSATKVAESRNDTINYEFLAKGIFIFSIGLFKKVFIADSFAKWANAGFGIVENGGHLNILESWATSLSYTFQLYFDFSGYCDMAMGLALMFGIILPLNFNSPYKSLNIAEFWRRWHITLGRFLKECLYIPLGGNQGKSKNSPSLAKSIPHPKSLPQGEGLASNSPSLAEGARGWVNISTKILTLRNLFIVAFLSGIWHGAGWGFVIWGVLHGVAMVIHRIYVWWIGNLSLGIHSADLLNRYKARTQSPLSLCRFSKNHESNTANTSIVLSTNDLNESSLRGSLSEAKTTKQSKNSPSLAKDTPPQTPRIRGAYITSPSLAEGDTGGGLKAQNNSVAKFSNDKSTLPLAPSAREGGQVGKSRFLAFTQSKIYKILAWFITFNFVNIAWIFFRAENVSGAVNLLKGMFGIVWVDLPQKWHRMPETLAQISGRDDTIFYIIIAIFVCVFAKNSFEKLQDFSPTWLNTLFITTITTIALFSLLASDYTPFLYFNF